MVATPVLMTLHSTGMSTITFEVFKGSDTEVTGSPYTATEETNRHATYGISVTQSHTGVHRVKAYTGAAFLGEGFVDLDDTATEHNVSVGALVDAQGDVYHAEAQMLRDQSNTQDEYTVTWFKNGVRQSSGITSPEIQVVKRVDGTDLIAAATAMTQIGSTGSYKYDEATNRVTVGESAVAIFKATIDDVVREFSCIVGRDS